MSSVQAVDDLEEKEMSNQELDELIAVKVMGWECRESDFEWFPPGSKHRIVWKSKYTPTTSIAQAMEALEKYCDDNGLRYVLKREKDEDKYDQLYQVMLLKKWIDGVSAKNTVFEGTIHEKSPIVLCAWGKTAQLAICEALGKAEDNKKEVSAL